MQNSITHTINNINDPTIIDINTALTFTVRREMNEEEEEEELNMTELNMIDHIRNLTQMRYHLEDELDEAINIYRTTHNITDVMYAEIEYNIYLETGQGERDRYADAEIVYNGNELPELEEGAWQEDWEDPDKCEYWTDIVKEDQSCKECNICGYKHKSVQLKCCKNKICNQCYIKLNKHKKPCPYCRHMKLRK